VIDVPLDDLLRNHQTVLLKHLIQPRGDAARAEVASPALKAIGAQIRQATLLDDDHVEVSIQTLGFPKKMDGEERTGGSTTHDGNAVIVAEAA
jgi:hypothetical protein